MKLKVPQEELNKALLACDKSLFAKAALPVLSNVLVSASKGKLEIVSTNLETATRVVLDCKIEAEGKTTVPGKVLLELVSQLSPQELTMEKLGEELLVSGENNSARLATMTPEEFPAIPKITGGKVLKVSAGDFASCAKKVEFCAAQDEARPALSGVLLVLEKKKFSMVATDGFRLSFAEFGISEAEKLRVLVPAKTIAEVMRLIGENIDDLTKEIVINIADNLTQINFRVGNIEFTSRLIEDNFPNWEKIIPVSFSTRVRFNKANLTKQIRIGSIFAREAGGVVRFDISGKTLTISANTSQVGSNEAKVEALEVSGKGGEIAFNFRYLLEALAIIDSEEVNFEMIESLTPGRLTSTDEAEKFFHIIMPVRLQG